MKSIRLFALRHHAPSWQASCCAIGGLGGFACGAPSAWPLALCGWVVIAQATMRAAQASTWRAALVPACGVVVWTATSTGWVVHAVGDAVAWRWAWQALVLAMVCAAQAAWTLLCWLPLRWLALLRVPQAHRNAAFALGWWLACATAETLRQSGWWGDGYGSLATAFVDAPGVIGWLPVLGAQGSAWLLQGLAVAIAAGAMHDRARRGAMAVAAALACCLAFGLFLEGLAWTRPASRTVAVTAVQPRFDTTGAYTASLRDRMLDTLLQAVKNAPRGGLVMTSEAYFPEGPPEDGAGRWAELTAAVRATGVHVLVGMTPPWREGREPALLNAIVQVSPQHTSLYAKERLVPGAERLPWRNALAPLYRRLLEGGRRPAGAAPPALSGPLYADGLQIGAAVCHEQSFATTMARRSHGSGLLVVASDDAWIAGPSYLQQAATLARLRAVETGKPLLRVSHGGPSALFEPDGSVRAAGADALAVTPREGETPYARAAEALAVAPLLAWCIAVAAGLLRKPARKRLAFASSTPTPEEPRPT